MKIQKHFLKIKFLYKVAEHPSIGTITLLDTHGESRYIVQIAHCLADSCYRINVERMNEYMLINKLNNMYNLQNLHVHAVFCI